MRQSNIYNSRYVLEQSAWLMDKYEGFTCLSPLQNLSNTLFMLPPFSMEMTRVWSSSLIHIKKVFSLLCLANDWMFKRQKGALAQNQNAMKEPYNVYGRITSVMPVKSFMLYEVKSLLQ